MSKRLTKYDKKMIEFNKRYDKFKKNNLPTPFWDDERQTFEFVLFDNTLLCDNKLVVSNNLYNAFENILWDNFYYPFNCRHYEGYTGENGEWIHKEVIGHVHEHDFDYVIRWLYDFPETFSIDKEDEHYYSEQELRFIKHLQKYLLFLGVKDREYDEKRNKRCFNKRRKKYERAFIRKCSEKLIKPILDGNLNYDIYEYKEGLELRNYNKGEARALVTNEDGDFIFSIEFGKSEIKEYKDVKKYYKRDLKDNDKVIVNYFKVLERF